MIERIAHHRLETPDGSVEIGIHHKGDPQSAIYLSIDAEGARIEVGPFITAYLADALSELSEAIPDEYRTELPDDLVWNGEDGFADPGIEDPSGDPPGPGPDELFS